MGLRSKLTKVAKVITHQELFRRVASEHLRNLENAETMFWGSLTEDEEAGIRRAVAEASRHQGPIVEVGALFGHTTILLATLKPKDAPLIAVENFTWNPFHIPPDAHRRFTRRTLRYVLEHCSTEIFDGEAADFYAANANLKPRMVFVDALHEYESVVRDIEWAMSVGCPVISGHDYSDHFPGVVQAVREAFGNRIERYGSVWIHHAGVEAPAKPSR